MQHDQMTQARVIPWYQATVDAEMSPGPGSPARLRRSRRLMEPFVPPAPSRAEMLSMLA
jgi:hypothetical protein